MQALQRPTMLDEVRRQPVEEFRMRGFFPEDAEVAGRPHQCLAEVPAPDAVHDNPCRKWIVRSGDGAGEFEASAALFKKRRFLACNDFEKAPGDHFPRLA